MKKIFRKLLLILMGFIFVLPSVPIFNFEVPVNAAQKVEVTQNRTENSKTYSLGNGIYQQEISLGSIHYKDDYANSGEAWKDIDLTWVGNRITKAPYELTKDGKKLTLKDKKTGEISTIELISTNIAGLTPEIVVENTRVSYRHTVPADTESFEAVYKVTGNKSFETRAFDDKDKLELEITLVDGILTEKYTAKKDKAGKVIPSTGKIKIDPTWQVGQSSDDCYRRLGGGPGFSLTYLYEVAGLVGGDEVGGGMRFTNITVPQGTTIVSSYLTLRCAFATAGVTNSEISAEDVDDAITFADDGAAFDARWATRTTAIVDWDAIAAWTLNTDYNSPEIKTVIQEIVNRALWVAGNDMVIFWEDYDDTSADYRAAYTYDSSVAYAPKLIITYSAPNVSTLAATNITTTSATLNGAVTYLGTSSTVYADFQYGETVGYGNTTDVTTLTVPNTFSVILVDLTPSTTYYFQARVLYDGGLYTYGLGMSFTTTAAAGSSTSLTIRSAAVFQNYLETGDMLVTAEVRNQYTGYYPSADPKQYFQIQLLNVAGTAILGAVPLWSWGDVPVSIYFAKATAVSGTSTVTGTPVSLASGANTVSVVGAGTVNITIPPCNGGTAATGTAAVAGTPVTLTPGSNIITVGGSGTIIVTINSSGEDSAYIVRMIGLFTGTPSVSHTLTIGATNNEWHGSDLSKLDEWLIGTAKNMAIAGINNNGINITGMLTWTTGLGTQLTEEGGGFFTSGIPGISSVRPLKFYSLKDKPLYTITAPTKVYDTTTWVSGSSYVLNDRISYNGTVYVCILAVSGATLPSADAAHWQESTGAWKTNTAYILNQKIGYGGKIYNCILGYTSTTVPPLSDATHWVVTNAAWVSGAAYILNDKVTYGKVAYNCILGFGGGATTPPNDITHWVEIMGGAWEAQVGTKLSSDFKVFGSLFAIDGYGFLGFAIIALVILITFLGMGLGGKALPLLILNFPLLIWGNQMRVIGITWVVAILVTMALLFAMWFFAHRT